MLGHCLQPGPFGIELVSCDLTRLELGEQRTPGDAGLRGGLRLGSVAIGSFQHFLEVFRAFQQPAKAALGPFSAAAGVKIRTAHRPNRRQNGGFAMLGNPAAEVLPAIGVQLPGLGQWGSSDLPVPILNNPI